MERAGLLSQQEEGGIGKQMSRGDFEVLWPDSWLLLSCHLCPVAKADFSWACDRFPSASFYSHESCHDFRPQVRPIPSTGSVGGTVTSPG